MMGHLAKPIASWATGAVLGAFAWLAPAAATAATDCKAALAPFVQAAKAGDAAAARGLLGDVETSCPAIWQVKVKTGLGKLHARIARKELSDGMDPATVRTRLQDWQRFGDHWTVQELLGSLAEREGDYTSAANHYMAALDLIDDSAATPEPPPADAITSIHKRTSQAMGLAKEHVAGMTRSSGVRAYYQDSTRGIKLPTKRPQITFMTNTAQFDAQGAAAINELTRIVNREASSAIVVAGHADERGDPQHNLKLSAWRMEKVKEFLIHGGFRGQIGVLACGEFVPPEITDPHLRSQEERWQLARRVEVFYRPEDVPEGHRNDCYTY